MPRESGASSNPRAIGGTHAAPEVPPPWLLDRPVEPGDDDKWDSSVGDGGSLNPRREHPDLVDAGARGDVERLLVGVAEAHIGGLLRCADGAEVLAFGRDDPDPAGAGLVEIALGVDPQSVGDAARGVLAQVDEQLAVGERA